MRPRRLAINQRLAAREAWLRRRLHAPASATGLRHRDRKNAIRCGNDLGLRRLGSELSADVFLVSMLTNAAASRALLRRASRHEGAFQVGGPSLISGISAIPAAIARTGKASIRIVQTDIIGTTSEMRLLIVRPVARLAIWRGVAERRYRTPGDFPADAQQPLRRAQDVRASAP